MKRTKILILKRDSPALELQFELAFLQSLTVQQRFDLMFSRSNEIKAMLMINGNRRPVEILKRP